MSAPSENLPIAAAAISARPAVLRHWPYFVGAAIMVALAATMQFDGYIHNILMQATTFAIAVFGLSVVLGLCGQINLAQAAFFGLGAYAVGIGTSDYHLSYWLCLGGGCILALLAGALLGMSTLRLGGHYLAMVTISFQQIVTLVMINTIWLTHGPDGVPRIGRPDLFQSSQSYLAFCVAMLALVGYAVGACRIQGSGARCARCATTSLPRAWSASTCFAPRCPPSPSVRCWADWPADFSPVVSPMSVQTSSPLRSRSCS